jgi:hypothetical protein
MREYAQRVVDLTAGHTKEDITEERDCLLRLSLERALEIIGEAGGGATAAGTGRGRLGSPWPVPRWLCGDAEVAVLSPDASPPVPVKRDEARPGETKRNTSIHRRKDRWRPGR